MLILAAREALQHLFQVLTIIATNHVINVIDS